MTNGFEQWMREWCERQGWPFQPEMAARDIRTQWTEIERVSPLADSDTRLKAHVKSAQEYWASVEGSDEWELAQLDRACEDETR